MACDTWTRPIATISCAERASSEIAHETHRTGPRLDEFRNGIEKRRLAVAIGAEQPDALADADMQAHALQHVEGIVAGAQVLNLEGSLNVRQSAASRLPR
nr:hypothetical protein [Mesorhizobium sediminum]